MGLSRVNNNFVILIGGPGLFTECDPKHDKTWLNYISPIQMAADKDLYRKGVEETVHWFVFEPPYDFRWLDDSEITVGEKFGALLGDNKLNKLRKEAADKAVRSGAANYIGRIKQLAADKSIIYHGLRTPDDFWSELAKFSDGSISRVWYSGHASPDGLMLMLAHDPKTCEAVSFSNVMIHTSEIPAKKAMIGPKFYSSTTKTSNFYGCGTRSFAEMWHQTFGVPAAGATNAITFSVIANPGNDVLNLIETTPTPHGSPVWTTFP